jgi:hypothetical protein
VAVALDTATIYVYNGATWVAGSGGLTAVADTNSIDLTDTVGTVTAALRLSAAAADAGYTLIANDIQGGGSPGLRSQILNTDIFGLFSATDTNSIDATFSAGAISAALRLSAAAADAGNFLAAADIQGGGSPGLRVQIANSSVRTLLSATAPAAYDNTTGVISWSGGLDVITAETGGVVAGAGKIGQTISATQAANTGTGVAASGSWGSPISVALTAGEWAIEGVAGMAENGATLTNSLSCGISASSSGVGIGGFGFVEMPFTVSGAADLQARTPTLYVAISGATTYYLNTRFYYTSGSPQHRGFISARRIR